MSSMIRTRALRKEFVVDNLRKPDLIAPSHEPSRVLPPNNVLPNLEAVSQRPRLPQEAGTRGPSSSSINRPNATILGFNPSEIVFPSNSVRKVFGIKTRSRKLQPQSTKERDPRSLSNVDILLHNLTTSNPPELGTSSRIYNTDSITTPGLAGLETEDSCFSNISKNSPSIYCLDNGNVFIGKLRRCRHQPQWTRNGTKFGTVYSIRRQDTVIEPELCMAGESDDKSETVQLKPIILNSVWKQICKKKVQKPINELAYLDELTKGRVEVHLRAPRFAGRLQSNPETESGPSPVAHSTAKVYVLLPDKFSPHGFSASCMQVGCTSREEAVAERPWIIEGLIRVDREIYALTTAHPIFDAISYGDDSVSELSASESSSSSSSDLSGPNNSPPLEFPRGTRLTNVSETQPHTAQRSEESSRWSLAALGPVNYASRSSLSGLGDYDFSTTESYFALVQLDRRGDVLYNFYESPGNPQSEFCTIKSISSDFTGGEVLMICSPADVRPGYLLDGSALFMNRMSVFHTKKIQTQVPFGSVSGTWVVCGGSLLRMIIAVYECEAYVHMLPVDQIIRSIQSLVSKNGRKALVDLAVRNLPRIQYDQEGEITVVSPSLPRAQAEKPHVSSTDAQPPPTKTAEGEKTGIETGIEIPNL
ncbi:uncharacterized protein BDR25DRAFT_358155 [Lindgomyces ingoldianus]|uniref:Uncharacterized protein n=1 Tax=Lindgomyces ingoldianus TaxID=673940 RepID=A0ACB6QMY3_9PLEO|nr:uncharacterized protein BDR25DRAFT_358155 [Lindgomyces ingoldianus]KAF2467890.1 hypothetical protein BDR25DRAFT_358155 [Lindgomyces ingoldianus]